MIWLSIIIGRGRFLQKKVRTCPKALHEISKSTLLPFFCYRVSTFIANYGDLLSHSIAPFSKLSEN